MLFRSIISKKLFTQVNSISDYRFVVVKKFLSIILLIMPSVLLVEITLHFILFFYNLLRKSLWFIVFLKICSTYGYLDFFTNTQFHISFTFIKIPSLNNLLVQSFKIKTSFTQLYEWNEKHKRHSIHSIQANNT